MCMDAHRNALEAGHSGRLVGCREVRSRDGTIARAEWQASRWIRKDGRADSEQRPSTKNLVGVEARSPGLIHWRRMYFGETDVAM